MLPSPSEKRSGFIAYNRKAILKSLLQPLRNYAWIGRVEPRCSRSDKFKIDQGEFRIMRVKCAVVFAATIAVLSAQQWEVAPVVGYLRLSKKPLGSLNQTAPKDDDTKLSPRQPAYGVTVTLNTKGYYGIEAGALRSRARIVSNIDPGDGKPVLESGTATQTQAFLNGVCYFMPRGERFRPYVTAGVVAGVWYTAKLPD